MHIFDTAALLLFGTVDHHAGQVLMLQITIF